LLACTGEVLSEAIRLRMDDITHDGLVIQRTKFRKSRLVPLDETARIGLERYLQQRRRCTPLADHVFVSVLRKPLRVANADRALRIAAREDGLPNRSRQPTPHALRHAFATRAMVPTDEASTLFSKFHDRIYRYLLRMVHNPSEAEDLTQETFLRAHSHRYSLRDPNAVRGWMYRIATGATLKQVLPRVSGERSYPRGFGKSL
jgi:hypothetical protein